MTRARTGFWDDPPGLPPEVAAKTGRMQADARARWLATELVLRAAKEQIRERRHQAWKDALAEIAARDTLLRRRPRVELPKCGARTRSGQPCAAPPYREPGELAVRNGRCRMHGGLSTGPRTGFGRARCGDAARRNLERLRSARARMKGKPRLASNEQRGE